MNDEIMVKIAHDYVLIQRGKDMVQVPIHEVLAVIHPAISRFINNHPNHLDNPSYLVKSYRKVVSVKDFETPISFDKPNNEEIYFKDEGKCVFERVSKSVYDKYIKKSEVSNE